MAGFEDTNGANEWEKTVSESSFISHYQIALTKPKIEPSFYKCAW